MRRVHESRLSSDGLLNTLTDLNIQGVVPTGALAWNTYPVAARAEVFIGSATAGANGPTVGLIAPNLLSLPYHVTHLNWASFTPQGNNVCRWTLQDSLGVTRRVITFQRPNKVTGGVIFGQSVVASIPPIPLPPTLGVKAAIALDSSGNLLSTRAYLTALLVQPKIVPALLAVAPTALGAVLPTTAAGTVVTQGVASWAYGSYVQLTAGLSTGALVTAVNFTSLSDEDGQIAFASGGAGSEVDWGVFGWAEPGGGRLVGARYSLMPYPLYVPASTRLAARGRGPKGSDTFNVGLEYIPIPLR